jgi:hypothetical protein
LQVWLLEEHKRPDPDLLLAHVQAEELQQARGKLKIFLDTELPPDWVERLP